MLRVARVGDRLETTTVSINVTNPCCHGAGGNEVGMHAPSACRDHAVVKKMITYLGLSPRQTRPYLSAIQARKCPTLWRRSGRPRLEGTGGQLSLVASRSSQVSLNDYEKQNASKERRPGGVHRVGSPRVSAGGPTGSSRESSSWSSTNHGKERSGLPGSSGLSEFRSGIAGVWMDRRQSRAGMAGTALPECTIREH